jgi:hypothetical protein
VDQFCAEWIGQPRQRMRFGGGRGPVPDPRPSGRVPAPGGEQQAPGLLAADPEPLLPELHRRAVKEKLGHGDQLSGFLQWVGTYCGYISFLTAEYIKLRSNVYRIAALLLGIKEACAIGTGLREYVEALLGRLRQEKSRNT